MPTAHPTPRHAIALRVAGLPGPLAVLEALGPRPGLFLRLAAAPGFDGPAWSFLGLAKPALSVQRFARGHRLANVLAPLRPRPVRRRGPRLPFTGGFVGYLGYEARSGVERTPPPRPSPLGFPAVWLGRAAAVLAWEHRTGRVYVGATAATPAAARRAATAWLARARRALKRPRRPRLSAGSERAPRARLPATVFRAQVQRVRRHVRDGDLFQANLSQRFDARTRLDAVTLFAHLVAAQPAPYMTFLALPGGRAVLSASPERFLRVQSDRVRTAPMKGTRPRGATAQEDRRLRAALAASRKDQAELAMIVDLSRNDLARVCRAGSVRVRATRRLLRFARVHQAIGIVDGRLAPGRDRVDLLAAAFPPGSVTGAPKVRALEVIDALEGEGRGPYCGALGWLDAGGDLDLAVGIRTLLLSGTHVTYRVGGGITLRSRPMEEWRETLTKGRGLEAALARGAAPRAGGGP